MPFLFVNSHFNIFVIKNVFNKISTGDFKPSENCYSSQEREFGQSLKKCDLVFIMIDVPHTIEFKDFQVIQVLNR